MEMETYQMDSAEEFLGFVIFGILQYSEDKSPKTEADHETYKLFRLTLLNWILCSWFSCCWNNPESYYFLIHQ